MVVDSLAGSIGRSRTAPSCSSWPGARRTTRRSTSCSATPRRRRNGRGSGVPPDVPQSDGPEFLLYRHPGRQRRHRGAGLGGDAAAHVPALLRAQGLPDRDPRRVAGRGRRHQERQRQGRPATTRTAICAPRPASTGSCARARSIRTRAAIRRSPACSSIPEVDETIEVEINPADLRIDTFRASGAGGQHINKTDSAVRITHLPTNIVVQCQNDRSQHRNRAEAMAMLKSRLYELELRKRQAEQQKLEDAKTDIGWGHQIRSYVLDQSRIKDLRTNVRSRQHAGGARRRSRRLHRGEPEAGGVEVSEKSGTHRVAPADENQIIAERRGKLKALRAQRQRLSERFSPRCARRRAA